MSASKADVASFVKTLKQHQEILDCLAKSNDIITEQMNVVYQRVEDMSKKFDLVLNAGIKQPISTTQTNTGKKKSPITQKPNKNIMTYFKSKYAEDPLFFNDILEEKQVESVIAEHKEDIMSKKKGAVRDKAKITYIYKSLTGSQKKQLREKMLEENEAASINTNADLEPENKSE